MRIASIGIVCPNTCDPEIEIRPIIEQFFHSYKPSYRVEGPRNGPYQIVIWDELIIDEDYDLQDMAHKIRTDIHDSYVFTVNYNHKKTTWEKWNPVLGIGLTIAGLILTGIGLYLIFYPPNH